MDPKRLSFGLGLISIALGVAELVATRRIARALGNDHRAGRATLRAFGAREMLAGAGLIAAPAHSTLVWSRVAGDAMDLAALGLAARQAPRHRAVWGALAFVAGATVIDALVARALDRTTGRALPVRSTSESGLVHAHRRPPLRRPADHANMEPEELSFARPPDVTRH